MKICFLIDSLAPGGAERSTAHLAIWLRQHGHEIHIATLHDRHPNFSDDVVSHGIEVIHLGNTWRHRFLELKRFLEIGEFDILHSCLLSSDLLARSISMLSWNRGWNLSSSIVNNSYGPHRLEDRGVSPWKLELVKLIDSLTMRIASPRVHAVTRSAALNAAEHLKLRAQDIAVVYRGRPGTHIEPCRQEFRHRLKIPDSSYVFIHVARQEHQKNHCGLITAFDNVWRSNPETRLLLVGRQGNGSSDVQRLLALSPARSAILCLGHRMDVAELLRCADAFVLPSHYEGLSGSMLEAMEAGLPVICSDLEGLKEGCDPDRSALLCDPGKPETIARAMQRLLDEPGLGHRLGERGREIYRERFTLDSSCQRMLSFFESVVADSPRAGHSAD